MIDDFEDVSDWSGLTLDTALAIEGSGAFFALDSLPGLAQARLDFLSGQVRQV